MTDRNFVHRTCLPKQRFWTHGKTAALAGRRNWSPGDSAERRRPLPIVGPPIGKLYQRDGGGPRRFAGYCVFHGAASRSCSYARSGWRACRIVVGADPIDSLHHYLSEFCGAGGVSHCPCSLSACRLHRLHDANHSRCIAGILSGLVD